MSPFSPVSTEDSQSFQWLLKHMKIVMFECPYILILSSGLFLGLFLLINFSLPYRLYFPVPFLFSCMVVSGWMLDIVKFTLLCASHFSIPRNILELCFRMLSSSCKIVWFCWDLLLNFIRWDHYVFYPPLLKQYLSKESPWCPVIYEVFHSGW